MPWSSHWHVGPVFNTNIVICMLNSVSLYKAQNKAQNYQSLSICSNSWHVHLCMCRDSHKLLNRKGFFVPLPSGQPSAVAQLTGCKGLPNVETKIFLLELLRAFNTWSEVLKHELSSLQCPTHC